MSLFRPRPFFPCPPPGPQSRLGPQDTLAETLEECRSLSSQRAQATAAPGTRASGTLAFTLVIHVPNSGLGAGDVIVYAKHLQRASHCIPFVSLIFFSVSRSHLHSLVLGPFVELFQTLAFFYCHISYSSLRFSCLPLVKIFLDYIVFIWIIQDGNTPLQDR